MTKTESSADLINNLLLNLDNLKTITENNKCNENNSSIKDQLESLKNETAKITNQYTQQCNTNTKTNKTKKIPPPIITGKYHMRTKFQTIDDMLFELNNVSIQAFGGKTPAPKSGKGKKIPGSFIDPRRYSDPYKYTILSTLDESADGEEEDIPNNLQTPKTALPYYSRKKDYKNISSNGNLMVPFAPKSAGCLRNRSYSQPERYSSKKNMISSTLHESASINYNMKTNSNKTSTEYLNRIKNSIVNENINKKGDSDVLIKPPRTSSMSKHGHKLSVNKIEEFSCSETLDSDPNSDPVYFQYHVGEMQFSKNKLDQNLDQNLKFHYMKILQFY